MLSTGRSEGAFQIEVRAHDQRRSWEGRGSRGVLVSMMSMHVHTRVYGARCWCAWCRGTWSLYLPSSCLCKPPPPPHDCTQTHTDTRFITSPLHTHTHTSATSTTTTTVTTTTSPTKKKNKKKKKPRAQSLWDDLISSDIWKRPHRANKIKLRPCLFFSAGNLLGD